MKVSALGFQSCLEGDVVALCCSKFRPQMVRQNHWECDPDAGSKAHLTPGIILTRGKVQESSL